MAVTQCICALLSLAMIAGAEQGAYKMWLEGITPCGSDSNPLVDVSTLKLSHHNRTSFEVKGAAVLLSTVDEKATMRLVAYKKNMHGSWSKTLLDTRTVKVCDMIATDKMFWPSLVDISNLPPKCPIEKGSYQFSDAYIEMKNAPAILPLGCYRLEVRASMGQLESCSHIMVKITGPNDGPNPRCSS